MKITQYEKPSDHWGGWQLNKELCTLQLWDRGLESCIYDVHLDECVDSAHILDWICQIAGKAWATDEVLAGLVRAFNDILAPQETACSWGINKFRTQGVLRQQVAKWNDEGIEWTGNVT